tara:strand:+ start:406 stop:699 length:294 start_codon:yes stop_codon:yes gene_type:complete
MGVLHRRTVHQHLICRRGWTITSTLYALIQLVNRGRKYCGPNCPGGGHAIGVVLVINAVAKAAQKDHVQEDVGIIAEIDGIMYVLKDWNNINLLYIM